MFEYKKEIISIKDIDNNNIILEMNKLGKDGWDVFHISECIKHKTVYGDTQITTEYTLYMKKII